MANKMLYANLRVLCSLHSALVTDALRTSLNLNMFKAPDKQVYQQLMYFLLKIMDCGKGKFKVAWPVRESKRHDEFFNSTHNFLRDLTIVIPGIPVPALSFRTNPSGERCVVFMLKLSNFALQYSLQGKSDDSCPTTISPCAPVKKLDPMREARLHTLKAKTRAATQTCIDINAASVDLLEAKKEESKLMVTDLATKHRKFEWIDRTLKTEHSNEGSAPDVNSWQTSEDLVLRLSMVKQVVETRLKSLKSGILPASTQSDESLLHTSAALFRNETPCIQELATSFYAESDIVLTALLSIISRCLRLIHVYAGSMPNVFSSLCSSDVRHLQTDMNPCSLGVSEAMKKIIDLYQKFCAERDLLLRTYSSDFEEDYDFMLTKVGFSFDVHNVDLDCIGSVSYVEQSPETNLLSYFKNNLTFSSLAHYDSESTQQFDGHTLVSEDGESGYITSSTLQPSASMTVTPCSSVQSQTSQYQEHVFSSTCCFTPMVGIVPPSRSEINGSALIDKQHPNIRIDKSLVSRCSFDGEDIFSPVSHTPSAVHSTSTLSTFHTFTFDSEKIAQSDDISIPVVTHNCKLEILNFNISNNDSTPYNLQEEENAVFDDVSFISQVSSINLTADILSPPSESPENNVSRVNHKGDKNVPTDITVKNECSDEPTPKDLLPVPGVNELKEDKPLTSRRSIDAIIARLQAVRNGRLNAS